MSPFPLPEAIVTGLRDVQDYWRGLRRGGNEMPFWDDLRLTSLAEMKGQAIPLRRSRAAAALSFQPLRRSRLQTQPATSLHLQATEPTLQS